METSHLCVDRRIYNVARYYLGDPREPLMALPDPVMKCVGFVGYANPGRIPTPLGTFFFVSRPVDEIGDRFVYAVTARHCIDAIKTGRYDTVHLRINIRDAAAVWVALALTDWAFHPDPTVDVALTHFTVTPQMDHAVYPLEGMAREHQRRIYGIGPGDALFMPGLFTKHSGVERNSPIVRHGIIAAMPDEKVDVKLENGKTVSIDAYLVELRSIKGLSGSPVFVDLGMGRHGGTTTVGPFFHGTALLGLMRGHYSDTLRATTEIIGDAADDKTDSVNVGISAMTPVEKLWEAIQQPKVSKKEQRIIKKIQAQAPSLSEDAAVVASFTGFDRIVAAIARVPKDEADAAEAADRIENPRIPRGPKRKPA